MKYTLLSILLLLFISGCTDANNDASKAEKLSIKVSYPTYDSFTAVTGGFSVNFNISPSGTIFFEAYKKGQLSHKMRSVAGCGGDDMQVSISILDSRNSPFKLQTNDEVGDEFYVFTQKSVSESGGSSGKFSCKREIFELNAQRTWNTFPNYDLTKKFIPIFYITSVEMDASNEHGLQPLSLKDDGSLDIKEGQDYIIFYLKLYNK